MHECILLMGGPGTGKTRQLVNVARCLEMLGVQNWVIDMENKFAAEAEGTGGIPKNVHLYTAFSWTEYTDVVNDIVSKAQPGDWITVDRIDSSWEYVRDWYDRERYNVSLGTKLLSQAKEMKKAPMLVPEMSQGEWSVVKSNYNEFTTALLRKARCHTIFTTSIRSGENVVGPFQSYGLVRAAPTGEKNLGHIPVSAFLLTMNIVSGINGRPAGQWQITTARDLEKRGQFNYTDLRDFAEQYLSNWYYQRT